MFIKHGDTYQVGSILKAGELDDEQTEKALKKAKEQLESEGANLELAKDSATEESK